MQAWIEKYDDDAKLKVVTALLNKSDVPSGAWLDPSHRAAGEAAFKALESAGWVEAAHSDLKTCMLYVDFRRRFGASRAVCLK